MPNNISAIIKRIETNDPTLISLTIEKQLLIKNNELRELFFAAIKQNNTLKALVLSNNQISIKEMTILLQHSTLEFLDVSHNPISKEGIELLPQSKRLLGLNLAHCRIDDLGAKIIQENHTLLLLNLSDNPITVEGIRFLAKHPKLLQLELAGNLITDIGARILANNQKLLILNLSGSGIGDSGVNALALNPTLKKLNLRNNNISFWGTQPLSQNQTLLFLDVEVNMADEFIATTLKQQTKATLIQQRNNFVVFAIYLASGLNKNITDSYFSFMPKEILLHICNFLDFPSLKWGVANSGYACAKFIFDNFNEIRRKIQNKESIKIIETGIKTEINQDIATEEIQGLNDITSPTQFNFLTLKQ